MNDPTGKGRSGAFGGVHEEGFHQQHIARIHGADDFAVVSQGRFFLADNAHGMRVGDHAQSAIFIGNRIEVEAHGEDAFQDGNRWMYTREAAFVGPMSVASR